MKKTEMHGKNCIACIKAFRSGLLLCPFVHHCCLVLSQELALLHHKTRSATVLCKDEVSLLAVCREVGPTAIFSVVRHHSPSVPPSKNAMIRI